AQLLLRLGRLGSVVGVGHDVFLPLVRLCAHEKARRRRAAGKGFGWVRRGPSGACDLRASWMRDRNGTSCTASLWSRRRSANTCLETRTTCAPASAARQPTSYTRPSSHASRSRS